MKKRDKAKSVQEVKAQPKAKSKQQDIPGTRKWLAVLCVMLFTVIALAPNLSNRQFINLDDHTYIHDNPGVKSLSIDNIKAMFSNYVAGNYHPLTIYSLAVDYKFNGLKPSKEALSGTVAGRSSSVEKSGTQNFDATGYHTTALLLHLLSVALLFFICLQLTGELWIAIIASLLFGIHPMHVESVAWISARKDQLYVLFYFAALLSYIAYLKRKEQLSFLFLTALFFLLSLLSKAQAVTLPVVMLLIDYYLSRKWSLKVLIEKAPFFILSLVFGIVALKAQKSSGAIAYDIASRTYVDGFILACYALVNYLWKMVLPLGLSLFYPYPLKSAAGSYSAAVYLSPFILLLLGGLLFWFRKNKTVVFGALFFLVNIVLILQLLPVGNAMMADRYSYLSFTGLFFIAAVAINNLLKNEVSESLKKAKPAILGLLGCYLLFLSYSAYSRSQLWHSCTDLWLNALDQYPQGAIINGNLGDAYQSEGKSDSAFIYLTRAIELDSRESEAFLTRAYIYTMRGKLDSALSDCNNALRYRPNFLQAYENRGIVWAIAGQLDSAMRDFTYALKINPNLPEVYANIGRIYKTKGMLDSAIINFSKSIQLNPNNASDYYERSQLYNRTGNYPAALQDALAARNLGKPVDQAYLNALQAKH